MLPALIPAFALISTGALAANFEDLPSVDKLPAGYAIFDELTPTIGQPYAIVRDGKPTREFYPGAPVYFTYKGKVIGTAIELDKKDFSRGLTFDNLTLPNWLPSVEHIDIIQKNEGSHGLGPSVSVRAWFLPEAELDKIQ